MARPRKPPVGSGSVRELVASAVAEGVTAERVAGIVGAAFGASVSVPVLCPKCGEEFEASVPDLKKQLETLIALGQAEARADVDGATMVVVERPAR